MKDTSVRSAWAPGGLCSYSHCTQSGASRSQSRSLNRSFPRATDPWLGKPGLAFVSFLYVLGSALVFSGTYQQERFIATPRQLIGVVGFAVVLIVAAFLVRPLSPRNDRPVPGPWVVGAFAFLTASTFMIVRVLLADWPLVFAYLLLYGLVAVVVVRWSGRVGWGAVHRLSLAGGALLTYAWHSFPEKPVLGSAGTIDLIGNIIFSIVAVLILVAASRAVRRGGLARRSSRMTVKKSRDLAQLSVPLHYILTKLAYMASPVAWLFSGWNWQAVRLSRQTTATNGSG